jgi:hypothetical protein
VIRGRRWGYFLASKEGSQMSNQLQGRKVAILAADGVEKVELERPRAAVEGAGGQVQLLSLKTGEIQAREHDLESAGTFPVDRAVADASVESSMSWCCPVAPLTRTSCGSTNQPWPSSVTSCDPASRSLPSAMGRGLWSNRRSPGSHAHVVSQRAHRSSQRWRHRRRPGSLR